MAQCLGISSHTNSDFFEQKKYPFSGIVAAGLGFWRIFCWVTHLFYLYPTPSSDHCLPWSIVSWKIGIPFKEEEGHDLQGSNMWVNLQHSSHKREGSCFTIYHNVQVFFYMLPIWSHKIWHCPNFSNKINVWL